ncbi:MAG: DUF104 domain-containing protein [Candidatus Methanoperedens sp.]|nr:DUF104 domain-containing protein [Candidatus Methanoperedens sp.]
MEAVYEDNVLKPIKPIKGIMEHENIVVTIRQSLVKKGLREIAGTLTHEEAEEMQELIEGEFEKIEGDG